MDPLTCTISDCHSPTIDARTCKDEHNCETWSGSSWTALATSTSDPGDNCSNQCKDQVLTSTTVSTAAYKTCASTCANFCADKSLSFVESRFAVYTSVPADKSLIEVRKNSQDSSSEPNIRYLGDGTATYWLSSSDPTNCPPIELE